MSDYRRSYYVLLTAVALSTLGSFVAAWVWNREDLLQYYCFCALFVSILSIYLPADRFIAGRGGEFGRVRPTLPQGLICVTLGFALFLFSSGLNALIALGVEALGWKFPSTPFPDMTGWRFFAVAAMVALVPAFCEETLFRGALLNAWRPLGRNRAVALCALTFALMHASPLALPSIFLVGWVISAVAYDTRSCYASMIVHFVYNFVICVVNASSAAVEGTAAAPVEGRELLLFAGLYIAGGLLMYRFAYRRLRVLCLTHRQPGAEPPDKRGARLPLAAALVILAALNVWGFITTCI